LIFLKVLKPKGNTKDSKADSISLIILNIKKTEYKEIKSYKTKDGAIIRELMHPDIFHDVNQSLAEATIPVGSETLLHRHLKSDEIYYIIRGYGMMFVGDEKFNVGSGDTIYIPSGTLHKIQNISKTPLTILCFCCPPYSHEDTELQA
jgi:mannose-6-phosphate isomerase-like protein (cupin superfamily)